MAARKNKETKRPVSIEAVPVLSSIELTPTQKRKLKRITGLNLRQLLVHSVAARGGASLAISIIA